MKINDSHYRSKSVKNHLFQTIVFIVFFCSISKAQHLSKRVLFLGNSYTYVNNLPQMIADMASSTSDTLTFDSNTPGGYTLQNHSTNSTSLAKIALGNWDYVVLQEQSQLPSFTNTEVETLVYPYAHILDSIIKVYNPCAQTVFYMTWGRKNGDASNCSSWPPVCTYAGMDSLLRLRYNIMADTNNAIVSPVGAVWKNLRQNFPLIELYQADESHPSVAGTYAAACSFYTALFRKDPSTIGFNSTLLVDDATNIKNAAKLVVYDSLLNWHIGEYDSIMNLTCLPSSVKSITIDNLVELFPNPTTGTLIIKFADQNTNGVLQIFNAMGILVKEIEAQSGLTIDVSSLPNGLYLLRQKNQSQHTYKFVKQ